MIYNIFDNEEVANKAKILDFMIFMETYNDDGKYTKSLFGSLELYYQFREYFIKYKNGEITEEEALAPYNQYVSENGSWDKGMWAELTTITVDENWEHDLSGQTYFVYPVLKIRNRDTREFEQFPSAMALESRELYRTSFKPFDLI
jgi:hypothetical protein